MIPEGRVWLCNQYVSGVVKRGFSVTLNCCVDCETTFQTSISLHLRFDLKAFDRSSRRS